MEKTTPDENGKTTVVLKDGTKVRGGLVGSHCNQHMAAVQISTTHIVYIHPALIRKSSD